MRFSYQMSLTDIQAGISGIDKRSKTLRENIQQTAVSILVHVHKNGNTEHGALLANNLVEALGEGMRRNSLQMWFVKHAGFVYNSETKELVKGKKKGKDIDAAAAKADPWEKAVKAEEPKPFDLIEALGKVIASAEKDRKKRGENSSVSPEQIAALKALAVKKEAAEAAAA